MLPSFVAIGAKGEVHVLFRNSVSGQRDMSLATTSDGKSFATAKKLSTGSWKLDACPMDGGMVAVTPKGEVVTAWRRHKTVFTTIGVTGKETSLGQAEQPFVAALPSGAIKVWINRRPGDLWMQTGLARPEKLPNGASDPVVATSAKAGGPTVVCWEGSQNGRRAILVRRIY
jgi:hypothetical protein